MTDTAIEDINRRLDALTEDVNALKRQAGSFEATQVAVAEILNLMISLSSEFGEFKSATNSVLVHHAAILSNHSSILANNSSILATHSDDLRQLKSDVAEILRILRDRNGGSSI